MKAPRGMRTRSLAHDMSRRIADRLGRPVVIRGTALSTAGADGWPLMVGLTPAGDGGTEATVYHANRSAPVHLEDGCSADCAAEMVLREAVSVGWLPEK